MSQASDNHRLRKIFNLPENATEEELMTAILHAAVQRNESNSATS